VILLLLLLLFHFILSIIYFRKCNTGSRTEQTVLIVNNTFLKAQPEDGSIEMNRKM